VQVTTFGRRTRQEKKLKGNDVVEAELFQAEARRIEKLLFRVAWSYIRSVPSASLRFVQLWLKVSLELQSAQ